MSGARVHGDSAEAQAWIAARIDPASAVLPENVGDDGIEVPVSQYDFFRLPDVVRFAAATYGIALPALPPAIDARPLATLADRVAAHVADLDGRLAGTPIRLRHPAHGLDELLALATRHAAQTGEAGALRLLGVVCNAVFLGPKTFHLDVSNLCNTDCVFCGLHSPHLFHGEGMRGRRFVKGWKDEQLPYETFTALVDDLAELGTVEDVLLSGEGEPLTHPRIVDMIGYIKARGMHLTLFTNGLLVRDKVADAILDAGVDVLYWSLSAATAATFGALQPAQPEGAFARMVDRFAALCDRKRASANRPYVVLAHVINNLNFAETAEIAALAMRVGVDAIRYQVMHSVPATERFLLAREQYEEVVRQVARGKRLAARSGIDVVANIDFQLPRVGVTYDLGQAAKACEWSRDLYREIGCFNGWFFARSFTDGRVSFCCHDKIVGNLGDARFRDLWRGDRYRLVREVARDFDTRRNVDLTDGVCGGWLLGPDCDVCGNYEFINQAWADLERTGLVRFLHRPAARTDAPDAAGGFADLVRESGAWPADDAAARRLVAGIERAARAEGESAALRLLGTIAGKPLVGPRWFIVEIINACNANCLYCNIHNPDRRPDPEWRKQRLSLADFRRIADDLAAIGGEGITLLANGEPLLHPEFPAMMRLAREKGLAVGFFTNGTLLTGALASEAVALGVAEINVTVSAATPETYARLHHSLGPADFDRAIASVRFLRARRDAAGAAVPRLVMVNVVTGPSAGEVEAMVRLAADAGFDEVRFQMVRLDDFNRALALTPDQLTGLRTAWPSIEKAARERGVALWPGFAPQLFATADETGDWEADRYVRHGCFVGYHLGLVKANGDFSFCCVVKPLANLRDVSLAEAWRSETYAKARHAALDLARRGDLRLADGTTLLSDRCRRCDNHDVNRLAHEALTRYGLWEFVGAVPPEDGR